jgi:hypothetical protein
MKDLVNRFTVPNKYAAGNSVKNNSINLVVNGWSIPGGLVTTTFSADGLVGTNTTTLYHAFKGTVNVTAVNGTEGGYMTAHGTGGYGPPTSGVLNLSFVGAGLDAINQMSGPSIFNTAFERAFNYAQQHFDGC